MRKILATSALIGLAAALTSTSALADGLSYGKAALSYYTDGDSDATRLDGTLDYAIGEVTLSVTGGGVFSDGDNFTTVSARAGYSFGAVTPYLSYGVFDFDSGSDDFFGLGIDYIGANFGAALEYVTINDADVYHLMGYFDVGQSQVYGNLSDLDGTNLYTLGVDYNPGKFDLSAATMWNESGLDDGYTALGISYDFVRFSLNGQVLTGNTNFLNEGEYSLGVGYNLTERTSIDISYADGFGNGGSDGIFGLKLTYEFGGERARVADRIGAQLDKATPSVYKVFGGDLLRPVYGPSIMGGM